MLMLFVSNHSVNECYPLSVYVESNCDDDDNDDDDHAKGVENFELVV